MQYSVSRLDNIYLGVGTIGTFRLADNCPVAATCYAPHTAEVAPLPPLCAGRKYSNLLEEKYIKCTC